MTGARPSSASQRELAGHHEHDEALPDERLLWRRDACFRDVSWLPRVGRLLADDVATWSLELFDGETGTTVGARPRGEVHSAVRGVLLGASTEQPLWIGGLQQGGPKLCWVRVQRDGLRIDSVLPIDHGLQRVLAHGADEAVLCSSRSGEVLRARAGQALWSFRAAGDEVALCRALGDDGQLAFAHARDGLSCLDGDSGAVLWTNAKLGRPHGEVPVALRGGHVYYLDARRAYRLDASDGAIQATLELPEHKPRLLTAPAPGVSAALVEHGAFICDGERLLGELTDSGTSWGADGRIEEHTTPASAHRVWRTLGEHSVEIGPNSLLLPMPAGVVRRRMESRWLRLSNIEWVGPATDRAVVLRRRADSATSGEWLAVRVF